MKDGNNTLEGPPEENDPVEGVKEISRTAQRLQEAETAKVTAEALLKTAAATNEAMQAELLLLRTQAAEAASLKEQLAEANRRTEEAQMDSRKHQAQLSRMSRQALEMSADPTDQPDVLPMAETWENLRADAASSNEKVNSYSSIRKRVFNLAGFMKFREAASPGNMVDKLAPSVIPVGVGVAMLVGASSVGIGATAAALTVGGIAGGLIGATVGITIVVGAAPVTCIVCKGMEHVAASIIAAYLVAVPMAKRSVANFKTHWNEYWDKVQAQIARNNPDLGTDLGTATA